MKKLFKLNQAMSLWFDKFNPSNILESIQEELKALAHLKEMSIKGLYLINDIKIEIRRKSPCNKKLNNLGNEITILDEQINQIGLTHPAVKPLSDLFSKRKENFCGDDIKLLANKTRKCYNQLLWEISRLEYILKYLLENSASQAQASVKYSLSKVPV